MSAEILLLNPTSEHQSKILIIYRCVLEVELLQRLGSICVLFQLCFRQPRENFNKLVPVLGVEWRP